MNKDYFNKLENAMTIGENASYEIGAALSNIIERMLDDEKVIRQQIKREFPEYDEKYYSGKLLQWNCSRINYDADPFFSHILGIDMISVQVIDFCAGSDEITYDQFPAHILFEDDKDKKNVMIHDFMSRKFCNI